MTEPHYPAEMFCPQCGIFFDEPADWLTPCCCVRLGDDHGADNPQCPVCGDEYGGDEEIPVCPRCGNDGGELWVQPDYCGCLTRNIEWWA